MSELIWVGNTLYPRWFVFAVPMALVAAPFVIAGIVTLFRGKPPSSELDKKEPSK